MNEIGGQGGLCHYNNGGFLDDGGFTATSYQFATSGPLPGTGHPQHRQSVPQLHERGQHDILGWHHRRSGRRELQPAYKNRSASYDARRCQTQMVWKWSPPSHTARLLTDSWLKVNARNYADDGVPLYVDLEHGHHSVDGAHRRSCHTGTLQSNTQPDYVSFVTLPITVSTGRTTLLTMCRKSTTFRWPRHPQIRRRCRWLERWKWAAPSIWTPATKASTLESENEGKPLERRTM